MKWKFENSLQPDEKARERTDIKEHDSTARSVAHSLPSAHMTLSVVYNTKKGVGVGGIMNRRKYNISHLHVKETLTLIVRGVQLLK